MNEEVKMVADSANPSDIITDISVASGGGALGIWSWRTAMGLHNSGYQFEMIGGSSTGCIVAFLYAKGFFEEAEKLYKLTYDEESRNIFEPGIAKVKKGKLEIAWIKAIANVFRIKHIESLMTNNGLYDTFMILQKKKASFDIPMFFNTTSLITGEGVQHSSEDFIRKPTDLCAALTASTSMPGILPMWDYASFKSMSDGGLVSPLPLGHMFARMDPNKPYRFWNIMCNPIDILPKEDLDNVAKVAGRAVNIMLNKILRETIGRTEDRNHASKTIWPIAEELDTLGLTEIADKLRAALGYKYMPIHNIIYSGTRGVFEFTKESYEEQILTARNDVDKYLDSIKT